jgi:hypothetical protein
MGKESAGAVAAVAVALLLVLIPITSHAAEDNATTNAVPPAEGQIQRRLLVVPFPFTNDTIGPGLGVGVIANGYGQPQSGFVGAALVGSGSYLLYFKALNYQFPWVRRLIFEPDFEVGKYHDVDTFTGTDNPGYPGERAGSNDSNENNYIESDTTDQWVSSSSSGSGNLAGSPPRGACPRSTKI